MTNNEIHPVRISLFGTGCKIWVGKFNETEWENMNSAAGKVNMPLTSAVFFSAFYSRLNNPAISSIADLGNSFKISGLLDSNHSIIQIQVYRKRRRNINFSEIIRPTTLFPIYNTNMRSIAVEIDNRMLFIVEKEIGLFFKFTVVAQSFILDKLLFEFTGLKTVAGENFDMLTNLYYEDRLLIPSNGNSLICGQYALTGKG